jgi:hypothetical protein
MLSSINGQGNQHAASKGYATVHDRFKEGEVPWERAEAKGTGTGEIRKGTRLRRMVKPHEELTERQRKFAELYFELNNGTKSAKLSGYAESSAHAEASRLLKNVKVREYLGELHKERRERILNRLGTMVEKSVEMLFELAMNAESESVRLASIRDLLDRAGFKPVDRVENKSEHNGKITFSFQDPNEEED